MTRFNPKGVFFWSSLFCVAGCVALGSTTGAVAFGILALGIVLFS